jgi:F-box and WD-40 domain protein CDC4
MTTIVYSIVYDRYRRRCASGSMDNTVKVWDVDTGECLQTLTGHTSLVGLLANSPNYIVSAAADASLRIWDANTHELKHILGSHGSAITCFAHDETKVVSGSDGSLKLWDIRTGEYVRDLVVGIQSVWQVVFRNNVLVAATNRGGNTVFEVFDFGGQEHSSGVDDEMLDTLRKPLWERGNPREPQAYQTEEEGDYLLYNNPNTHDVMKRASGKRRESRRRSGLGQDQGHESDQSHAAEGAGGRRRSYRLVGRKTIGNHDAGTSMSSFNSSSTSTWTMTSTAIGASRLGPISAAATAGGSADNASGGEAQRAPRRAGWRAWRAEGDSSPTPALGPRSSSTEARGGRLAMEDGESFAPIFDDPMDDFEED